MIEDLFDRLDKFMSYKGLNDNQMTVQAGLSVGSLGKQRKGARGLSSEGIAKILYSYKELDANWLLTGEGEMLKHTHKDQPITHIAERVSLIDYESNIISIPIVDVSAAAGHGCFNPDYTETLGEINLPTSLLQKKYGNYYCGIVNGESMAPTLLNQDYIIFRLLSPDEWIDMKDEKVYFIVDRSGSSCVKRVKNNLKSEGNIICMSDSIDKANFRDFTIAGDDLVNIYHVEWHFSKDLTNINDLYYDRLGTLEADMKEIKERFKKLK